MLLGGSGLSCNPSAGGPVGLAAIPGLVLDIDASDVATITKDGSNVVSAVLDKSPSGLTATAAAGEEPVWSPTALNGLPAFTQNGLPQHLRISSQVPASPGPVTIFIVGYYQSGVNNQYFLGHSPQGVVLGLAVTPNEVTAYDAYSGPGGYTASNYAWSKAPDTPFLLSIIAGQGGTNTKMFQDGTLLTDYTGGDGADCHFSFNRIGTRETGAAHSVKGGYSHVVVYDRALTTEEHSFVATFLKTKWGL